MKKKKKRNKKAERTLKTIYDKKIKNLTIYLYFQWGVSDDTNAVAMPNNINRGLKTIVLYFFYERRQSYYD